MSRFFLAVKKLTMLASVLAVFSCALPASAQKPNAQPPPAKRKPPQTPNAATLIRWSGRPGVERYRLQLASDEGFNDIVFDRAVTGRQLVVSELPPGKYFWRVAPAVGETGSYTKPVPVEINSSGTEKDVAVADVIAPSDTAGWRTATGEVPRLVAAHLRSNEVVDIVAVNRDGLIFAIDGTSGIALWTARFRPEAKRGEEIGSGSKSAPFIPLVVTSGTGETTIVVAYDGGIRALHGVSGKEIWRAKLDGAAASGVAADIKGDGATQLGIVTDNTQKFYVLDGKTGAVISDQKLDADAIGSPFPLTSGETRGFALTLKNNKIQLRGLDGNVIRETKESANITTAPLVVQASGMQLLIVGVEGGLEAITVSELKTLGRIAADNDMVRGTLTAADLDGDGATEIVMVTKRGRVALVSTLDGTVKWYSEGALDADSAAFADLNGDGILDVIVPGGASFAYGFSGRDGHLIWKVEEDTGRRQAIVATNSLARAMVVAATANGAGMVVGSDPSRVGLRAIELPKGSVKAGGQ